MSTNVVTIDRGASIQEALTLMKQASIRHLPVVDEERQLIGWVTDADLRGVLIASMLEELTLEDVMVRKPYAAHPDMALEDAVRIILDRRIRGLPVVEHGKLVGIITVVDILKAFITTMGMLAQSSRLDVRLSAPDAPLHEITRLIREHSAEVLSICHIPTAGGEDFLYSIRLKKCDLDPLVAELAGKGIEVVSAIS